MANISRLTLTLFTGGDLPLDEGLAVEHVGHWQAAGIATVIDCRAEWSDRALVAAAAPGIRYVHLGMDDIGQRVPPAWFERVLNAAGATPAGSGVLVHCHMGINRGPSGAYALLLADGHDPVEAIDLIRRARPVAAVGYAEDALRWWHQRTGATTDVRSDDRGRLARWRREHPHDTVRIIRSLRARERSA